MASAPSLTLLSYAALTFAYLQAVLGAFVRITGSGMGCGDHWPKCHGFWFPPLQRVDLIIEVTHRYVAAALTLLVLTLLFAAWRSRATPGVGGPGGVLRPAAAGAALVVAAALLGALTVKLELHAAAVVVHLAIAMMLIGALALAAVRSRSLIHRPPKASARAIRGASAAAATAFLAVLLGGITANLAGAAVSCVGFPHCRAVTVTGAPLAAQILHRILAVALLLHLLGLVIAFRKRGEPGTTRRWAQIAFAVVVAQILVAAGMVETGLPLHLRILHQALGTLVWLTTFVFAAVARQARVSGSAAS
ncbi:MAG: COX15/CtaA family protein [Gemmatimonadaceae bacterium]